MFSKIVNFIRVRCRTKRLEKLRPEMLYSYSVNGERIAGFRVGSSTVFVDEKKLVIEPNVFIGHHNFIEASNGIRIGEGSQLTNFISVITHSSHIAIRLYGKKYRETIDPIAYRKGAVDIGIYTFVGPHVTIMPGTTVGKGCLISAYSLLKGTYPDFSIISGNPAIVVGDTRKLDEPYLSEYPELRNHYSEWAERK